MHIWDRCLGSGGQIPIPLTSRKGNSLPVREQSGPFGECWVTRAHLLFL